jgi:serine/threonine protein phosphatase PrpC
MVEDGLIRAEDATPTRPATASSAAWAACSAPQHRLFCQKTPLMTGDILLLCSDGFWGPLPQDVIPRAV